MTPVLETAPGLLMETPIGNSGWLALAWWSSIFAIAVAVSVLPFRRRTYQYLCGTKVCSDIGGLM